MSAASAIVVVGLLWAVFLGILWARTSDMLRRIESPEAKTKAPPREPVGVFPIVRDDHDPPPRILS